MHRNEWEPERTGFPRYWQLLIGFVLLLFSLLALVYTP